MWYEHGLDTETIESHETLFEHLQRSGNCGDECEVNPSNDVIQTPQDGNTRKKWWAYPGTAASKHLYLCHTEERGAVYDPDAVSGINQRIDSAWSACFMEMI